MSGRARHWRDGELITNRKTDRRQRKHIGPLLTWRLLFLVPQRLLVSPGPTGIVGVTVLAGGLAEAKGGNLDWVLQQAASFVGSIAVKQVEIIEATLEREAAPARTEGGPPSSPAIKATREMVYVPGPSVVMVHPRKKALVFAVK